MLRLTETSVPNILCSHLTGRTSDVVMSYPVLRLVEKVPTQIQHKQAEITVRPFFPTPHCRLWVLILWHDTRDGIRSRYGRAFTTIYLLSRSRHCVKEKSCL